MRKHKIVKDGFSGEDTAKIARSLLGKFLVRTGKGAYMITEVEAYDGPRDKASHASRGRTERNEVMFREGGCIYIYLVYGMHNMLNIVTGPTGYPAAVLIRGIDGRAGPGKLTRFLGVDRSFNKRPLGKDIGLWIEDRGVSIEAGDIKKGPRVGVDYAGPFWSARNFRFWLS
jgi:DNA-3-methyladenine glycosylase